VQDLSRPGTLVIVGDQSTINVPGSTKNLHLRRRYFQVGKTIRWRDLDIHHRQKIAFVSDAGWSVGASIVVRRASHIAHVHV
jgi:hypothetical protein